MCIPRVSTWHINECQIKEGILQQQHMFIFLPGNLMKIMSRVILIPDKTSLTMFPTKLTFLYLFDTRCLSVLDDIMLHTINLQVNTVANGSV